MHCSKIVCRLLVNSETVICKNRRIFKKPGDFWICFTVSIEFPRGGAPPVQGGAFSFGGCKRAGGYKTGKQPLTHGVMMTIMFISLRLEKRYEQYISTLF